MVAPRHDRIEALVQAMLAAAADTVEDATISEVFSAYFTLLARALTVTQDMGIDPAPLRALLLSFATRLSSDTVH